MKKTKRFTAFLLACFFVLTSCSSIMASQEMAGKEAEPKVNYVVVEEPMVTTPGTQRVMFGIGDGSVCIDTARMYYYKKDTGESFEVKAAEILEDFVLFQMQFGLESQSGAYQLDRICYAAGGKEYSVTFDEMGIDAAFGVNQSVESKPDDVLLTDEEIEALAAETEMNIVSLDEEGRPASGESLEEAMESAGCEAETADSLFSRKGAAADSTGMSSMVVVLDAGHGGYDSGAVRNGIVEKIVNLKIAQYCKAELETYAGVLVYMTRESDVYLTLAERAQVAIDKKADVMISLHNNSSVSSVPCGANVYYPNGSYNAACESIGRSLASIMESKLTALGLASGGIHIRNSENNTRYPDGSLADYYGIIKRCKESGIPALIVEHAFVSNAGDAKNYLTTEEQLRRLGVADAAGIAEFYRLQKGLGFNSIQSNSSKTMDLVWTRMAGVTGYIIYRSTSSTYDFMEVARIPSAETTAWRDTGLKPGTTYYYKICSYTQIGTGIINGPFSKAESGTTIEAPKISYVKSKDSSTLEIKWPAVSNAANYEVYRSDQKKGTYARIAVLAGNNAVSYMDTALEPGKLYYYKVRSYGVVDRTTVYSSYSPAVSGRTARVPENVYTRSLDSKTLRISWKADSNAAGYMIQRADSADGEYKTIVTIKDKKKNYYDDTAVKAGAVYYYRMQSYNYNHKVKGFSGYGSAVSGKTLKKAAVTKIFSTSPTKQIISWKEIDGADGYDIYQSTSKDGKYKKIATVSKANKISYKVSKLKEGTRYFYKVRARKESNGKIGYGSYSTIHGAWTGKKAVITAVQAETANSIQVFWNPIAGVKSYDIYRGESAKGTFKKVGSVSSASVSYTDKKLKMTTKYFYRIEARMKGYKADGMSGVSAAVGGYPIRSTNIVSVLANGEKSLAITWGKVDGVTGYQIYRSTQENTGYKLLNTVSKKNTTFEDASAERGILYYYKVVLVSSYNKETVYGIKSAAVSGMIPAAEPDVTDKSPTPAEPDVTDKLPTPVEPDVTDKLPTPAEPDVTDKLPAPAEPDVTDKMFAPVEAVIRNPL